MAERQARSACIHVPGIPFFGGCMLTRVRVGREDDDGGTKASPGAARAAVATTTRRSSHILFLLYL